MFKYMDVWFLLLLCFLFFLVPSCSGVVLYYFLYEMISNNSCIPPSLPATWQSWQLRQRSMDLLGSRLLSCFHYSNKVTFTYKAIQEVLNFANLIQANGYSTNQWFHKSEPSLTFPIPISHFLWKGPIVPECWEGGKDIHRLTWCPTLLQTSQVTQFVNSSTCTEWQQNSRDL